MFICVTEDLEVRENEEEEIQFDSHHRHNFNNQKEETKIDSTNSTKRSHLATIQD